MAVLVAVTAGCGDAPGSSTIHAEGPLRKIDTGEVEMAAAFPGHLAIVDGCIVQQGLDGRESLVVWPLDVHWDDAAGQVVFPDDRRLALGTDIVLAGGFVSIEDVRSSWPNGQTAADALAACQPDVSSVWIAGHEFNPFEAFDLDTHCGIYGTMIDGVWWRAKEPLDNGHGGAPEGWADPSQSGTMAFVGDDLAVFTADGGLLLARFEPTASAEPQGTCA